MGNFELELRKRFRLSISLIECGNFEDGVPLIKGLGHGLTPSGDDFIAGMMSGLRLASLLLGRDSNELINRIYDISRGGNFLSNAFLYCTKEGWYMAKQKSLIEAMLYGDESEVINRAESLLTIGETSGADWGTGFVMILNKANELL